MTIQTDVNKLAEAIIIAIKESNLISSNLNTNNTYTLADWCDIWLDTYKKNVLKPLTYLDYKSTCDNWIKPLFGAYMLNNVDTLKIQQQINNIAFPRAKDKVIQLLNQMFNKAVDLRYIPYNPMNAIESKKHIKEHNRAFDNRQREMIINASRDNPYGDVFIIAMFTGTRRGEILALTRADIDYKNRLIKINKSFNDTGIGTPKTKTSIRDIPMINDVYDILLKYKDFNPNDRLFPYSTTTINKHFKRMLEKLGIYKKGYTFHSLRDTYATLLYENGVKTKVVSKWMGHSHTDITIDTYTQVTKDLEINEINKIKGGLI